MRATKYFVLCTLIACGPASRNGSGDDDDNGGVDAPGTTDPGPGDGCSAAAKLVYVVDEGNGRRTRLDQDERAALVRDARRALERMITITESAATGPPK